MNKKILISGLLVGVLAIFLLYEKFYSTTQAPLINNNEDEDGNVSQQETPLDQNNQPDDTPVAEGKYASGQYTGNVVNAFYGDIQVKAVVTNGKLADVVILQYPNHTGHTLEVSTSSLPRLKSEALQSQSAKVNIVSGATQTSQAFMQSLQSALVKAGAQNDFNIQVTPPPQAF